MEQLPVVIQVRQCGKTAKCSTQFKSSEKDTWHGSKIYASQTVKQPSFKRNSDLLPRGTEPLYCSLIYSLFLHILPTTLLAFYFGKRNRHQTPVRRLVTCLDLVMPTVDFCAYYGYACYFQTQSFVCLSVNQTCQNYKPRCQHQVRRKCRHWIDASAGEHELRAKRADVSR